MRKLIRHIKRELKKAKHCAIYEEELSGVWPHDGKRRELLIEQFARDNGSRLRFIVTVYAQFSTAKREKANALGPLLKQRLVHKGFREPAVGDA